LRESFNDGEPAPSIESAIDVMAGGATAETLSFALQYGVGLSYAEHDTLGLLEGKDAAVQRLVTARRAGVPFRVLRSATDTRSLAWPNVVKARLADQRAAGFMALVPDIEKDRDATAIAWWRIDPRDRVPIATAPNGEGEAIIEGTILLREVSIPQVEKTLTYVACLNLAVVGGASPAQANAECLCNFLGNNLRGSVERWGRSKAVDKLSETYGLGPQVKLILSQGTKYLNKAANLPPKEPVSKVCKALTH
jgi:hypothetical protein